MSEYLIQSETLTGIADAIRGKTGGTDPVAVSDMAAQIEGIETGGGDVLKALIDGSITEFVSADIENVGKSAFYERTSLEVVSLPNATNVGYKPFKGCTSLKTVSMPRLEECESQELFYNMSSIRSVDMPLLEEAPYRMFSGCTSLSDLNVPNLKTIGPNAFFKCSLFVDKVFPKVTRVEVSGFSFCAALEIVDFPLLTYIGENAFSYASALKAILLRNTEAVCALYNTHAFGNTPINSGTGYIYVPSALIEQYKVATNWSTYAAQFRALEDYTVDGTTTGELDPTKTGT